MVVPNLGNAQEQKAIENPPGRRIGMNRNKMSSRKFVYAQRPTPRLSHEENGRMKMVCSKQRKQGNTPVSPYPLSVIYIYGDEMMIYEIYIWQQKKQQNIICSGWGGGA